MKSITLNSIGTILLRDGMHATFIGMDTQFGGNLSWVVTKSGEIKLVPQSQLKPGMIVRVRSRPFPPRSPSGR